MAPRSPRPTAPYHHGHLRQALVEAALRLVEQRGPDGVTVREAARREGVSAGAPFRHFESREALLAAVAAEAAGRLRGEVERALRRAPGDPLERLLAMGRAYLRWAGRHPALFLVASAPRGDGAAGGTAGPDDEWVRAALTGLIAEGQRAGRLRPGPAATMALAARALVYGLARMRADGQLRRWGVPAARFEREAGAVLRLLLAGLAPPAGARPGASRRRRRGGPGAG